MYSPIPVVVAHNQFLVREGLKAILSRLPGVAVITECENSEGLSQALEKGYGLLILDPLSLDGFTTSDLDLLKHYSGWKVLVISACEQITMVRQVVESGVGGYLTRTCDQTEIEEAVKRVYAGETTYCHKVLDLLVGRSAEPGVNCDPAILSEREVEIVKLIAAGYTTKEIADKLYRSSHTISTHRKNIMRKLQVRTSSELMVFALHAGIVNET